MNEHGLTNEEWAELGRRVADFLADLPGLGLDIDVTWDRPHGEVRIVIRAPEAP